VIQFKLLAESLPTLQVSKIYLKLSLLFSAIYSYNGTMVPSVNAMESVTLKLENIPIGIFHYCEAEFTECFSSSVSFTLFSMITDFKLFPYSMRKEVIPETEHDQKREKEREKVMELNGLLQWAGKYVKTCSNPIEYFYTNFAKVLRYNSYHLRKRVYEHYVNPKQVELKLPKFYK
jgi:hypothetical protein